jgi:hypothetical protein
MVFLLLALILCMIRVVKKCKKCKTGEKLLVLLKGKLMWSTPIRSIIAVFLAIAITAKPGSYFFPSEKKFCGKNELFIELFSIFMIILIPSLVIVFGCCVSPSHF